MYSRFPIQKKYLQSRRPVASEVNLKLLNHKPQCILPLPGIENDAVVDTMLVYW